MNNRQVLKLAGWLAEHGFEVVSQCRSISVAALRNHLAARQDQFRDWLQILHHRADAEDFPPANVATARVGDVLTAVREIAAHGVLLRVGNTVLYSIGERLDIPLAQDVTNQTARTYGTIVRAAMVAVASHAEIPASELSGLDRLGRLCDRLSDLFCGTLLPALACDRFVVDRERAADFAQTFGHQPALARLPLRKAAIVMSSATPMWSESAGAVERSLIECLPILVNHRSARPDELTDLVETFRPKIYPYPDRSVKLPACPPTDPARPVSFPTVSFAQLLRQARDRREY